MAVVDSVPTSRPGGDSGDGGLVGRVGAGDAAALEQLYQRYGRPAYALARRITGENVYAEEVVQEVFLALWRSPDRYDPLRGAFASWLLAAVHHKAVDTVRREETLRRHRAELSDLTEWLTAKPIDSPPVEDAVWAGLQGEQVRRALLELPRAQREALALAYYTGYTQREIALLTDTPLGTVKTRMLAGMRRLRDILDAAGLSDRGPALMPPGDGAAL